MIAGEKYYHNKDTDLIYEIISVEAGIVKYKHNRVRLIFTNKWENLAPFFEKYCTLIIPSKLEKAMS